MAGAFANLQGGHYDVILLDDIVDEKNSATEKARARLLSWYYEELMPCLEPGGKLPALRL